MERQLQKRTADEAIMLSAQLDALMVMTSGDAFINKNDQGTLLRLLSGMRALRMPFEKSPLSEPVVVVGEIARFRSKSFRNVAQEDTSGSRNPVVDAQVSRTLSFAHAQLKQKKHRPLAPRWTQAPKLPEQGVGGAAEQAREQAVRDRVVQKRLRERYALQHLHRYCACATNA